MTAILSRPIDQIKAVSESTEASAFPILTTVGSSALQSDDEPATRGRERAQ
ncbi:hypothetical protein [Microbacterium marinilacus]|uniref:Uncharacterized protein n=1 Tax=Microbacterium marinilacus TaxID=415209 RepID=A0ABP7BPK9_9MICO|nr:hypothetical protein [Microbacterium marinilacus]